MFIRTFKASPNQILFIEIFFWSDHIFHYKISEPEDDGGDLRVGVWDPYLWPNVRDAVLPSR